MTIKTGRHGAVDSSPASKRRIQWWYNSTADTAGTATGRPRTPAAAATVAKSHIVIPRAPYHLRARQVRRSRAGGFQRPCQRLLLGRAGIYLSQKGAESVSVVSLNAGLAVQLSCGGFKAVRVGFHKTGSRQRLQESTAHIQASTTCTSCRTYKFHAQ